MNKYYDSNYPEFARLRDKIREILSNAEELEQVVQLVGKSALSDSDKITLDVATLIKEDFYNKMVILLMMHSVQFGKLLI